MLFLNHFVYALRFELVSRMIFPSLRWKQVELWRLLQQAWRCSTCSRIWAKNYGRLPYFDVLDGKKAKHMGIPSPLSVRQRACRKVLHCHKLHHLSNLQGRDAIFIVLKHSDVGVVHRGNGSCCAGLYLTEQMCLFESNALGYFQTIVFFKKNNQNVKMMREISHHLVHSNILIERVWAIQRKLLIDTWHGHNAPFSRLRWSERYWPILSLASCKCESICH